MLQNPITINYNTLELIYNYITTASHHLQSNYNTLEPFTIILQYPHIIYNPITTL
jgi:hypothetical protein